MNILLNMLLTNIKCCKMYSSLLVNVLGNVNKWNVAV